MSVLLVYSPFRRKPFLIGPGVKASRPMHPPVSATPPPPQKPKKEKVKK